MKKKGIKGFLIGGAVALGLVGLITLKIMSKKAPVEKVDTTTVEIVNPAVKEVVNYVQQIGTLSPAESVDIIPKAQGEVMSVNVKLGDSVKAGDVLASLTKDGLTALKIQMDTARINMNDANTALARTTELFNAGAASSQNLEQAQSAASQANLSYTSAKNQYDLQSRYTDIISPIDGVVEAKNIEVHGMVSQGSPAFVVSAQSGFSVKFGVTGEVRDFINIGDPVEVKKGSKTYTGTVTEIEETVSQTSGLYNVKAGVDDIQDLTSGSKVEVSLVKARSTDSLTVPVSSVYYSDGKAFVYVLKDGKAVKKDVTAGIYNNSDIVITEGLGSGDDVIYTWSKELYDGANVELAQANTSSEELSGEEVKEQEAK